MIGTSETVSHIRNKEAENAGCFKNLYNGGICVTELKKEKQENIETGGSSAKVQSINQPHYQNTQNIHQQMLNNQKTSNNIKNIGIHQNYNIRSTAYESGSNIVPREIARLHVSNSIDTHNVSGNINTPCDSINLENFFQIVLR